MTLARADQQFDVYPNPITQWRSRLSESAADVSGTESSAAEPGVAVKVLHAKLGELTLANDFRPVRSECQRRLGSRSARRRKSRPVVTRL